MTGRVDQERAARQRGYGGRLSAWLLHGRLPSAWRAPRAGGRAVSAVDVWVMLAFGLVGYFMEYARVPLAPFAIG